MRVGIVAPPWIPVPPVAYGGTEFAIDTLARGLRDAGHDVVLVTTGDATCDVEKASYWDTPPVPMGSALGEIPHVLTAYDVLADCDVVHDHTLVGPLLAARAGGPCPVVTTNHGPFTPELLRLYEAVAENVPVIAISHAQRATAPHVPVARVIHHGVRPEDFPLGDGRGGYVLFLGRMAPEKGVHHAAMAASKAGVPLRIAAKMREPEEFAYFEEYVKPLLGPDVEYVGEVGAAERLELLGGAIALVNPICWPEPFGLVMIESLACGTPVVAYRNGATPEIVETGVTGFLCEDEADLAHAIANLDQLDRAACRESAETTFSAGRMVREHVELYEEVV